MDDRNGRGAVLRRTAGSRVYSADEEGGLMDDKTAIELLGSIRRDLDQEGESSVVAIQHAIQAIEALGKVRAAVETLVDACVVSGEKPYCYTIDMHIVGELEEALSGKQEE
jgi:hypothetical protein